MNNNPFDMNAINNEINGMVSSSSSSMVSNYPTFLNDSGNFIQVRNEFNQTYWYNKSSKSFVDNNMNPIPNENIIDGYYFNVKNIPVVLKKNGVLKYRSQGFPLTK